MKPRLLLLSLAACLVMSACRGLGHDPLGLQGAIGSVASALAEGFSDSVAMSRRDVHARYDETKDELELVELCFDARAGRNRGASEAWRELLDGARIYPATVPWIPVDVDDLVERARKDEVAELRDLRAELLELAQGVRVVETSFFLDEREHVGLLRRWRIERFSRVVSWIDRAYSAGVRGEAHVEDDARTIELRAQWIATKRWYARIDGDRLVFDLPMSKERGAKVLATAAEGKGDFADLLSIAESVRITSDGTQFVVRAGADGWLRVVDADHGDDGAPITPEARAEAAEHGISLLTASQAAARIGLERLPPARAN